MVHSDVIARLRALGDQPVDAAGAASVAAATASAATVRRRVSIVAGTGLVVALATVGTVLAVGANGGGTGSADAVGAIRPAAEFECTGPPPWVAETAASDTLPETSLPAESSVAEAADASPGRGDEAREFAEWRAENCPPDTSTSTTSTSTTTSTTSSTTSTTSTTSSTTTSTTSTTSTTTAAPTTTLVDDDACTGPPPFAGVPAEPADPDAGIVPSPRAEEAHEHAAERQACHDGDTGDGETDDGDDGDAGDDDAAPGVPGANANANANANGGGAGNGAGSGSGNGAEGNGPPSGDGPGGDDRPGPASNGGNGGNGGQGGGPPSGRGGSR